MVSKRSIVAAISAAIILMLILSFLLPLIFLPPIPRQRPYDDVEDWGTGVTVEGGDDTFLDNITLDDVTLDLNWSLDPSFIVAIISPAEPPRYWRNTAYDRYTGTDWEKSTNTTYPLAGVDPGTEVVYTVTQNVTNQGVTGSFPLLSLWPDPLIINDSLQFPHLSDPTSYSLEIDDFGTALFNGFFDQTGSATLQYDVTYIPRNWTLIRPLSLSAISTPGPVLAQYQQQGLSHMSPSTRSDVQTRLSAILAGVPNTAFEQAFAIQNYFKTNFAFDPFAPRPSSSEEHVEWFLSQGGGIGIDFATTFTMFLREAGIAARPVYGAVLGENQGTQRVLHLMHVHFWVEVYIPTAAQGYWIQFDPTPLPSFITDGSPPPVPIPSNKILEPVVPDEDPYVVSTYINLTLNVSPQIIDRFTQFQITATLTQDGVPQSGQTISFYDETEHWFLGSNITSLLGEAQVTFTYNNSAIVGVHLLRAEFSALRAYNVTALRGAASLSISIAPFEANRSTFVHINGSLTDAVNSRGISANETGFTGVDIRFNSVVATQPLTDALGRYSVDYLIPLSQVPLGLTQVQSTFVLPGIIGLTLSPIEILNVTANSQLTVQALPNSIRLNSNTTLQGRLRFDNGTGIAGQSIQLLWNGTPIGSTSTDSSGYYTMEYNATAIGNVDIEAVFLGTQYVYGSRAVNTARVHQEGAIIVYVNDDDGDDITQRGRIVFFSGWVEDQNGTRQGGVPVRIFLNGTEVVSSVTLLNGSFFISYQIAATQPVGIREVTGTITHATLQVISSFDYFTINSSTFIQNLMVDFSPVMLGETVTLTGQLEDDQGIGLSGQTIDIEISYLAITIPVGAALTQPGGSFSFVLMIPTSIPTSVSTLSFDVNYSGMRYYGTSANSEPLDIFSNATLLIDVPLGPFAWNATILVNGTLVDNFGRVLPNRDIQLLVDGISATSTASNQFGRVGFVTRFTPSGISDITYALQLRHETIITLNSSVRNITVEAQQPMQPIPTIPPEWIIAIVVIIIVVVIIILVYRYLKRRPRTPSAPSIDAASMLTSLRQLLTDKKYREAIIYAFRMYETIIQAKLGIYRDPSITVREFANLTVAHGRLDSRNMDVFIRGVEEARYSDHPISYNLALSSLSAFASIYNSLTGGNLRFVTQEQQEPQPDAQPTESG
ncbi:MAG: transglutaminaseTgpA domain-containing protein [Candidatus Hermodarchaeia archaeon]